MSFRFSVLKKFEQQGDANNIDFYCLYATCSNVTANEVNCLFKMLIIYCFVTLNFDAVNYSAGASMNAKGYFPLHKSSLSHGKLRTATILMLQMNFMSICMSCFAIHFSFSEPFMSLTATFFSHSVICSWFLLTRNT